MFVFVTTANVFFMFLFTEDKLGLFGSTVFVWLTAVCVNKCR